MKAEEAIWPESWPSPADFFGDFHDRILSLHSRQLLVGSQIIVRFINGYGATILHNRLQEGLSEVAFLKYFGPGMNDFDFFHDGAVPDLTWCFDHAEIISLCESIAKLEENHADMTRAEAPS